MRHDIVIIGGGSAGCVLANRLSEEPSRRVLLLEAGEAPFAGSYPDMLADADRLGGGSAYDWGYRSEPGRLGYAIAAQSGKVLGGGSAINAAVAKRALASDFAKWERHGLAGWEFAQALQCYKALENTLTGSDSWHGRTGPFPIRQSSLDNVTKPLRAFVEAAVAAGFDRIDDFNGPVQHGVGIDPMNVIDGVRQNTGTVYLPDKVRARPNLTIRAGAQVDRIEFEHAQAARLRLVDGSAIEAGQFILSAGVYGSPVVLMRSGIGPAGDIEKLGIHPVADLPVGKRLCDHPFYYNTYALTAEAGAMHPARAATIWTRSAEAIDDELDLQVTASNFSGAESPTGRGLTLAVAVTAPKSVGRVALRSRDPRDPPIIDYNLLADPSDRRRMVEGLKLARRIAQAAPLAALIDREMSPGAGITGDDMLEAAIERQLDTFHHGCCTAPMGGDRDPNAVVDPTGAVRGVANLSVIDASILPEIPSTPINLTVIMLSASRQSPERSHVLSKMIASCRLRSIWPVRGSDQRKEDAMRDLILKMSISIDGFVGGPDGGIKWVFDSDQEAKTWTVETVWDASLHIMGSRTFHDMAAYWPTSTEVFAPPMNQIPKAVFSRHGLAILKAVNTTAALRDARANAETSPSAKLQPGGESWAEAYVASGDLADEVAKLKAQNGKPIIAHGGASFARSLVAQGLIDQYDLLVHPVALGKGLPVFSGLAAPKSLKLMSSKAFPAGSMAQIYRPA